MKKEETSLFEDVLKLKQQIENLKNTPETFCQGFYGFKPKERKND